jgi:hypothetical protein
MPPTWRQLRKLERRVMARNARSRRPFVYAVRDIGRQLRWQTLRCRCALNCSHMFHINDNHQNMRHRTVLPVRTQLNGNRSHLTNSFRNDDN